MILGQGISPSQSLDSLILWLRVCKKIISTFASAMNTSFSKSWLKVSWPQPFSHMTPLSCYYVIFAKRCVSSFTTLMTIKLGRVMSYGKGPYLHFQLTCRTRDHVLFEKTHEFTDARPQNSAGDTKHRYLTNQKLFLLFKRILSWIYITIYHFKDI